MNTTIPNQRPLSKSNHETPAPGAGWCVAPAEFCRAITGCAPENFIELRALKGNEGARRCFLPPDSHDLPAILRRACDSRWHIYFAVGPRTVVGHGDRAHVAGLAAVWVDVDFKLTPRDHAEASLKRFPLPPSALVETGGGFHVYLRLECFFHFDAPGDYDRAKSLLRKLAIALGADIASAEPARILRLPGSRNWKYDPAPIVRVVHFDPAVRYALNELEDAVRDVRDDRVTRVIEDWKEPPASSCAGSRPGDDFNARASWSSVLEPHGWRLVHQYGDVGYWRRPGKRDGISASTNYDHRGFLWVFSSNAQPLEAARGYTKFSALSALEYCGDCGAAASELARAGFGR
jgi:hypothetical protein